MKNLFKKIGAFFVSLTKQKSIIITGVISAIFGIIMIYSPYGKIGSHERHFRDLMEHLWEAVMFASFCEIPASFLTEKLKSWKKYLIQLVLGLASGGIMFLVLHLVKEESYVNMYYLGAIFVLVCFCVYIFVPKDDCPSYYANIFSGFLFSFLLVLVSFLGSVLLCYAFDSLICSIDKFSELIETMALIFFQVFFTVIYSYFLYEKRTQPSSKVFKVVFMYIVLPVYLLLIGVLYAYLLKALFMWKLPQGQINWFVSFATAIYLVIYFILKEFKEEKVMKIFYRFGGLILVPLIFVQFPTYFIRLNAYGFTGWRYTSLLYNIFATVCIIFTFIKDGKYVKYAIPVLGVLGIIAAFTPFNLINVAYNSQYGRLVKTLKKYEMFDGNGLVKYDSEKIDETITDEDRETLYGSYVYLNSTSEHKKPNWFSDDKYSFQSFFNIGSENKITKKHGRLYAEMKDYEIDISGFRFLKEKELNYSGYHYDTKETTYKNPLIYEYNNFNLKDYLINHDDESKEPIFITIDNSRTIIIYNYSYKYSLEKEMFESFHIKYFELKK